MEKETKKERNFIQRVCHKIAQILKTILKLVFYNPIPWVILTAVVFGRFYELGYFGMKGSTVLVSGVCEDFDGYPRTNIAQDQIVVSSIEDNHLEGVLRRTREYVKCPLNRISIDRVGTIRDLFKWDSLIPLPEISKLDKSMYEKKSYEMYLNKDILVSGTCMNPQNNKLMEPFREKVISVTNIKDSKENPGQVYFYGVREDNVPLVCDSQDITYKLVSRKAMAAAQQEKMNDTIEDIPVSYIGQKVFVTAICIPDMRAYRISGRKPRLNVYNLQKTPVEVIEEEIDVTTGKVRKLVGSVLAKSVVKDGKVISVLGDKIKCDSKSFPMIVVPSTDDSVKIEKEASGVQAQ